MVTRPVRNEPRYVSEVRVDNCINIVTDQLKCQTVSINKGPPHALGRRVYPLEGGDTTSQLALFTLSG